MTETAGDFLKECSAFDQPKGAAMFHDRNDQYIRLAFETSKHLAAEHRRGDGLRIF